MLRDLLCNRVLIAFMYAWAASSGLATVVATYDLTLNEFFELFWRESTIHVAVGLLVVATGWVQCISAAGYASKMTLRKLWWSQRLNVFHVILFIHALVSVLFLMMIWLSSVADTSGLNYAVPQRLLTPALAFSYMYLLVLLVLDQDPQRIG